MNEVERDEEERQEAGGAGESGGPGEEAGASVDPGSLQEFLAELRAEQNLGRGFAAGAIAAAAGAGIWAGVTLLTDYQIGWMAIALGFLVGFAVRFAGRGLDPIFGVVGAALALLGCLAGNYLMYRIREETDMVEAMTREFYDFFFYAIALYAGYRFSFRHITQEEAARLLG